MKFGDLVPVCGTRSPSFAQGSRALTATLRAS
jgi:hypothetical protein